MLQGLLIENREDFVPAPPEGLSDQDRVNFIRHFSDREAAERRWFGQAEGLDWTDISQMNVTSGELNSEKVADWVQSNGPDIVISFGVHKIDDALLAKFPAYAWNIHGGLSPWYRGSITLFWPFYFLQPIGQA